jgi:hypothetical protein
MSTRKSDALSCYFDAEERRFIETVADEEERPQTKIVQFAVRVFKALRAEDREKAMKLAQPGK